MIADAAWRPLIAKEVRALLLTAAVPMVVILFAAIVPRSFDGLAVAAFMVGATAIGAMAIGHEYTSRTLPMLLALPIPRHRALIVKWAVMALMLAALTAVGSVAVARAGGISDHERGFVLLPVVCGLFIAPWITMVTRSAMAGALLSTAVPGSMLSAGAVLGLLIYGRDASAETDAFQLALVWRGMVVACAAGAFLTWRTFMRLEAAEGDSTPIARPDWFRRAKTGAPAASMHHPLGALAAKELRLHQLSFAVAGIYVAGWIVALSLSRSGSKNAPLVFSIMSVIYGFCLFILAGSVASADERHMGTHETQLLLPVRSWLQWTVKIAVAVALAGLFGLALPAGLTAVLPRAAIEFPPIRLAAVPFLCLFAMSLYVSSATRSGVRALMLSAVALSVVTAVPSLLIRWAPRWQVGRSGHLPDRLALAISEVIPPRTGAGTAVAAACAGLLLWFALANHRSADQSPRRILFHVVVVVSALAGGAVLITLLN